MPRVGGGSNRGGGRTGISRSGGGRFGGGHSRGVNRGGYNRGHNVHYSPASGRYSRYNRYKRRYSENVEEYENYECDDGSTIGHHFILPIIFYILTGIMSFFFLISLVDCYGSKYNEERFREYASACYEEEFNVEEAHEDNLLIVILTQKGYNECYYISYVGNHVKDNVCNLFGNERSEFGKLMNFTFSSNYRNSLDTKIIEVMNVMIYQVKSNASTDSFTCDESHIKVESHITNKTNLEIDETKVNEALANFTEETEIPVTIVVDKDINVFRNGISNSTIILGFITFGLAGLSVLFTIRAIKKKNYEYEDLD